MTAMFGRVFGKRRAFFLVVAGIIFYTLLVDADGSVTWAAIMGILAEDPWAAYAYLGRQSTAIVSLFATAWLMNLIDPPTLWDVGFQLSFTLCRAVARRDRFANRRAPVNGDGCHSHEAVWPPSA
jgi:predicted membrane metal-binding protein